MKEFLVASFKFLVKVSAFGRCYFIMDSRLRGNDKTHIDLTKVLRILIMIRRQIAWHEKVMVLMAAAVFPANTEDAMFSGLF